jgi:hypothetical protein
MKTLVPMIALTLIVLMVIPAMGGEKTKSLMAFYEMAVDKEISQCREMTSLLTSRSPHLRLKGHREASKAMFLEAHRDQLVEDMMAQDIEPKAYKVDRFLNDRFSCTCYATWAAKGEL